MKKREAWEEEGEEEDEEECPTNLRRKSDREEARSKDSLDSADLPTLAAAMASEHNSCHAEQREAGGAGLEAAPIKRNDKDYYLMGSMKQN